MIKINENKIVIVANTASGEIKLDPTSANFTSSAKVNAIIFPLSHREFTKSYAAPVEVNSSTYHNEAIASEKMYISVKFEV